MEKSRKDYSGKRGNAECKRMQNAECKRMQNAECRMQNERKCEMRNERRKPLGYRVSKHKSSLRKGSFCACFILFNLT